MSDPKDNDESAEKPEKKGGIGKATMMEIVERVSHAGDKSDDRVADAYEKGMDAVTKMAATQAKSQDARDKRNSRIMMAVIAGLIAIGMGATTLKFFGVFEAGEDSSNESAAEMPMDDHPHPDGYLTPKE